MSEPNTNHVTAMFLSGLWLKNDDLLDRRLDEKPVAYLNQIQEEESEHQDDLQVSGAPESTSFEGV